MKIFNRILRVVKNVSGMQFYEDLMNLRKKWPGKLFGGLS
jgi:hypothetical protein